jgi:uncharacterized membrane protein YagU involved in acid resistance
MNQFMSLWSAAEKRLSSQEGGQQGGQQGDDATQKTADAISKAVLHHELSNAEKAWAGPAVHYGFGTIVGAVYGALAERIPVAQAASGAAYGSAVWLLADDVAVPALGLGKPADQVPVPANVKALASHVVYGVVTDATRRAVLERL